MPDDEAGLGPASGSASPGPGGDARRVLEPLDEAECMELLAGGGMGRLVFNSRYGPTALPVEYKIDEGSLVLGTWDPVYDEDLRTGIAHADYHVAVEADQINPEAREGSSSCGARHIIWTPRPSALRSSTPGSTRGSRKYPRTSSG